LRPPEAQKYLFDIAEACSLIGRFTASKSFEDYTGDPLLRSAVERQLAPDLIGRITDARRIVSFRNRLIHGYASVADELVWGVVERNLAILQREVATLLNEE
jgi:uncharacterized protein with HEPN domain